MSIKRIAIIAATVAIAGATAFAVRAQPPSSDSNADLPMIRVCCVDLDLTRNAGAAALPRRISGGANHVCGPAPTEWLRDSDGDSA